MNVVQRIKGAIKKRLFKISPDILCKSEWMGSDNGGFYVNPDLLNKDSIVYSFGIGEDISFSRQLIHNHGCKVWGFDPTPKSIAWINAQKLPPGFTFIPKGIAVKTGEITFYLPRNHAHVSASTIKMPHVDETNKINVPVSSFSDILRETSHNKIDVLKMDIEGMEYDVIPEILKSKVNIIQFQIEFHYRFVRHGIQRTQQIVKLFKEHGYGVFAVSKRKEEISFIKSSVLLHK